MAALLLAAVNCTCMQARIAPAADHLVAVVLTSQHGKRWLDDTATQAKHKVQSGLLLNVVVAERPAIFQLLASKDQALLVWRNPLLVLDLSLDIINGVGGLYVERDSLSCERFHKDLHGQGFPLHSQSSE